ncbi:hypothetical protein PR048_030321 [Dryococelus australis]|uniref:Uncharacterized protein n=1 Tax=Dryococelus australis TaxID=614101 RepID=A0ABQ9GB97_9NEOP|nr:hypothetical protein PR048_030321 [Dryococelus australis]
MFYNQPGWPVEVAPFWTLERGLPAVANGDHTKGRNVRKPRFMSMETPLLYSSLAPPHPSNPLSALPGVITAIPRCPLDPGSCLPLSGTHVLNKTPNSPRRAVPERESRTYAELMCGNVPSPRDKQITTSHVDLSYFCNILYVVFLLDPLTRRARCDDLRCLTQTRYLRTMFWYTLSPIPGRPKSAAGKDAPRDRRSRTLDVTSFKMADGATAPSPCPPKTHNECSPLLFDIYLIHEEFPAQVGETGCPRDPRENPPASGIIRHDSHLRKSDSDPDSLWWEANSLTTQPPRPSNRKPPRGCRFTFPCLSRARLEHAALENTTTVGWVPACDRERHARPVGMIRYLALQCVSAYLLQHQEVLPRRPSLWLPSDCSTQAPAVAMHAHLSPGRTGFNPGFLHVGIVPDDATGWLVFSGISRFPLLIVPALLHNHLNHPHRLSRPSLLRATQISSLTLALSGIGEIVAESGNRFAAEAALHERRPNDASVKYTYLIVHPLQYMPAAVVFLKSLFRRCSNYIERPTAEKKISDFAFSEKRTHLLQNCYGGVVVRQLATHRVESRSILRLAAPIFSHLETPTVAFLKMEQRRIASSWETGELRENSQTTGNVSHFYRTRKIIRTTLPGIEPASPLCKAINLTTTPPRTLLPTRSRSRGVRRHGNGAAIRFPLTPIVRPPTTPCLNILPTPGTFYILSVSYSSGVSRTGKRKHEVSRFPSALQVDLASVAPVDGHQTRRLDSSVLCILEPQLFVHWHLPHTWQFWDSQDFLKHYSAVARALAFHRVKQGYVLDGFAPGFSHVGIVSDNATSRMGFLGDLPRRLERNPTTLGLRVSRDNSALLTTGPFTIPTGWRALELRPVDSRHALSVAWNETKDGTAMECTNEIDESTPIKPLGQKVTPTKFPFLKDSKCDPTENRTQGKCERYSGVLTTVAQLNLEIYRWWGFQKRSVCREYVARPHGGSACLTIRSGDSPRGSSSLTQAGYIELLGGGRNHVARCLLTGKKQVACAVIATRKRSFVLRCFARWLQLADGASLLSRNLYRAGVDANEWELKTGDPGKKTRRQVASSGTNSTCGYSGATPPGNEPGSARWEARSLKPLHHRGSYRVWRKYNKFDDNSATSLCLVARSWFETRSEIGSTIDTENCCTIRVPAGLEIEMFFSNRRRWRFEISIRDQQPSSTNITVSSSIGGANFLKLHLDSEIDLYTIFDSYQLVRLGGRAPLCCKPRQNAVRYTIRHTVTRQNALGKSSLCKTLLGKTPGTRVVH